MAKHLPTVVGAVAGFLAGMIGCAALDWRLSPAGTLFGARDELGLSHEIAPILMGAVCAVIGGGLGRALWRKHE